MESKRLTLPEQKNYELANELAYKLACEQLAKIGDINWVSVIIGVVQIGLGVWFVILAGPGLISVLS